MSGGKINQGPVLEPLVTLADLFKRYHARQTDGKESNTKYTEKIHTAHLERLIGKRTGIRRITTDTLQHYVDERARNPGERRR